MFNMERYFKRVESPFLPRAHGELSRCVPSKSIKEANKAVESLLSKGSSRKRQDYHEVSTEMKSKIAKYAAENGIQAAIKKFKEQVPNALENWKNTVRDWKYAYLRELSRKRGAGDHTDVLLPAKRMGRALLLGDELDKQVQEYIKSLRNGHAVVNTAIVLAVAEGIVKGHDANLLPSVELTRDWAKCLMKRMGLTSVKLLPNPLCHNMTLIWFGKSI